MLNSSLRRRINRHDNFHILKAKWLFQSWHLQTVQITLQLHQRSTISDKARERTMLQSVRFALSSPRRRRRRRRHFLLPAARSIALIPGGSRIRTCAPLSERETPTCEQCAACRATDARLLREPTLWVPPPLPLPSLFRENLSLSESVFRSRPSEKGREREGETERKNKRVLFWRKQNNIHLSLSLSFYFYLAPWKSC